MASNNQLLGSGKVVKEEVQGGVERDKSLPKTAPCWLFHKDHPEGCVVKVQKECDKLRAAGWVDHPWLCTLLPGFEKLYEGKIKLAKVEPVEIKVEPELEVEIEVVAEVKVEAEVEPLKVEVKPIPALKPKSKAKPKKQIAPLFK